MTIQVLTPDLYIAHAALPVPSEGPASEKEFQAFRATKILFQPADPQEDDKVKGLEAIEMPEELARVCVDALERNERAMPVPGGPGVGWKRSFLRRF